MKTKLAIAALAALCFAFPASATDPVITSLTSTVYALPSSYTGACPGTISLVGDINVQGQFNPGQHFRVAYQVRNPDTGELYHAAPAPLDIVTFTAAGTQTVRFSVPVRPNSTGNSRWELVAWQIDVHDSSVRPLRFISAVTIQMTCHQVTSPGVSPPPPQQIVGAIQHLAIRATLYTNSQHYDGACPREVIFPGLISVTGPVPGPMEIGYVFIRSDGTQTLPAFVHVTGPGNTPVTDNWLRVEAPGRTVTGWDQMRVWLTTGGIAGNDNNVSPRADFSVHCR